MIGFQTDHQKQLFYSFNLEEHVPQNHLLRGINQFLNLGDLRQHLSKFYSHTGRPSIDPELMIRMLVIGYCFGIRSERKLCEEVHLNLAYRWFCRLGLEDAVPEHSTFSKNRHGRFRDSNAFRHLFEDVLRRCMAEGLVRGEGFATDASIIKADAQRQRGMSGDQVIDWCNREEASRPVREYLKALEEANDTPEPSKYVSLTDPSATWTGAAGGPAFFAYSTNYLVDLEAGIIVDVESSAVNKTAEVEATKTMIERVEDKFGIKPERLVGDTNYGSAAMLNWLVEEKDIEPHVPVWDRSGRDDGTLSSSAFQWDGKANEYRCPEGHPLRNDWQAGRAPNRVTKDDTIIYRSRKPVCSACPQKDRCCPNTPSRKITRSIHEGARDVARRIAQTLDYERSMRERKKVEMLFAHLKRILKLDKLRLRGPSGAKDEFLMAATVQNLRRMAKWLVPIAQEEEMIPA